MKNPFTVCIIDDDKIHQYTTTMLLEKNKVRKNIINFSDGQQAIDFMLNHKDDSQKLPNVILLDINMPVMDGWQFMEAFRKLKSKLRKKISIYMVSSSNDPADTSRAKKINEIADYLVKPFRSQDIDQVLNKLNRAV
ncbi:MAG: response regulator [Bacteroidia bacterium]|nr:response regulator [Bacteroidia bacterium]